MEHAFNNNLGDADALNSSTINGQPFSEYLSLKIATIGENLVVRRVGMVLSDNKNKVINGYIHANNRIGVLLSATCEDESIIDTVKNELRNIAMHAAAMSPKNLSYKDFSLDFVESETKGRIEKVKKENKELARLGKTLKTVPKYVSRLQLTDEVLENAKKEIEEQLKAEGKPEKIWHRILPGKLERF